MKKLKLTSLCLSTLAPLVIPSLANAADEWQFELTPYLWATYLDASVVNESSDSTPIDDDYDFFILDNLDAVASASFVAKKQKFTLYFDGFYAKYSDTINRRVTKTDLEMKLGFVEASMGYQLTQAYDISVIVGVRNIFTDTSISVTPGFSSNLDKSWTDPLIGLQTTLPVSKNWSLNLRGDIGGGVDTDYVAQTWASMNYQMTEHTSLKIAYRYMKAELKPNPLLENISLHGVQLGLGVQF